MERRKIISFFKATFAIIVLFAFVSITSISNATTQNANSSKVEYVEGEAIIMYRSETATGNALMKAMAKVYDYEILKTWNYDDVNTENNAKLTSYSDDNTMNISISHIKSSKYTTEELISNLSSKEWIISVEPNYTFHATALTNDSYIDYQWALDNKGTLGGTKGVDINPISTTGSKEKVIAVVDSGVNYNLADLKNVMWKNTYQSKGLSGTYGYDYYNHDTDPMDDFGHGTHCAGIIAAEANNNEGISGVVLGASNIKIMALKVMDNKGNLTTDTAIEAYDYISKAQDLGVNVVAVNDSWGGYTTSPSLALSALKVAIDEVGEKGALSICAAGNNSYELDSSSKVITNGATHKGLAEFPVGCGSNYVVSVAATNSRDNLATFSNYGSTIDIAAPGDKILSTYYEKTANMTIGNKEEIANKYKKYLVFDIGKEQFSAKSTVGKLTAIDHNDTDQTGKALEWKVTVTDKMIEDVKNKELFIYLITDQAVTSSDKVTYTLSKYGPDSDMTASDEDVSNHYSALIGPVGFSGTYEAPTGYAGFLATNTNMYDVAGYACISGDDYPYEHVECSSTTGGLFGLLLVPKQAGEYTIVLDNLGIIEASKADTLAKTDYYYSSGTSMAAPVVSGAVGTLSNLYEGKSAAQLKQILLNNATKNVSKLNGKVTSGRRLDLTKLEITNITLSNATVGINKTVTLNKSITPSTAADETINWTSSNNAIATVTSGGVVKGVKAGTVTITATTANGKKATANVQVGDSIVEATGVTLNKTNSTLVEGKSEKLVATVTPSNATDKTVTWSSSDSSIVKVDSEGTINALKAGTAIIIAKTVNEKQATCTVTVTENTVVPTSIEVTPEKLTMGQGSSVKLKATVSPTGANQYVTFSSADTSIATVNEEGSVKAIKAGSTSITVASVSKPSIKKTVEVTVNERTIKDIEIESLPEKTKYKIGEELNLTGGKIKVTYTDDTTESIDMSDDDIIVSGYNSEKSGEQELTLTYTLHTQKRLTFKIEVEGAPAKNIDRISVISIPTKTQYKLGEKLDLTGGKIAVIYEDNTTEEIDLTDPLVGVTGYDPNNTGVQTITVNYKNKLTTFSVTVSKDGSGEIDDPDTKTLTRIVVSKKPTKTTYEYGEKINLSGGKIKLIYSDDSTEEIDMTDSNVSVSGYNALKSGAQTITLNYKGKSTTVAVTVKAESNNNDNDNGNSDGDNGDNNSGNDKDDPVYTEDEDKGSGETEKKKTSKKQTTSKSETSNNPKVDTGDNIVISIIFLIISGTVMGIVTTELKRR